MGLCSRCKRKTTGTYSLCFACNTKRKKESGALYGTKKCKKCGTVITRDRAYCYPCYKKQVK